MNGLSRLYTFLKPAQTENRNSERDDIYGEILERMASEHVRPAPREPVAAVWEMREPHRGELVALTFAHWCRNAPTCASVKWQMGEEAEGLRCSRCVGAFQDG